MIQSCGGLRAGLFVQIRHIVHAQNIIFNNHPDSSNIINQGCHDYHRPLSGRINEGVMQTLLVLFIQSITNDSYRCSCFCPHLSIFHDDFQTSLMVHNYRNNVILLWWD